MTAENEPIKAQPSGSKRYTLLQHVGDAIDNGHTSPLFWGVMAMAASGYFLDVLDFTLFGSLVPFLSKSGIATSAQMPWIGSASALGLFVGSLCQGPLADRFGRKHIYQYNLLIYGVATVASAFAPTFGWLFVGRFVAGIGLGGEQPLSFVYISEYSPRAIRGRLVALMQFLGGSWPWPVGVALALLFGNQVGWRGIWGAVGVAALIVWAIRMFYLPESPRWLATRNTAKAALRILARLKLPTIPEEQLLPAEEHAAGADRAPFLRAFRDYPRRTIASMFCVASFFGVSISFGAIAPHLLHTRGITISHSLNLFFWMEMAAPAAQALMIYTVEKLGRRWNVIGSFVIVAITVVTWGHVDSFVALLSVGFCVIFFIQLGGNSALVCIAEVFSTDMRGSAVGIAQAAGRLASFGTIPLLFFTLDHYGVNATVVAAGAMALVAVVAVTQLPEPRGRSLDAIAPPRQP